MASVLEDAASGIVRPQGKWPPYKDAYAVGSPWSIVLALTPVTTPPSQWLAHLRTCPPHAIEGKTEPLPAEIAAFIESETTKLGWKPTKAETPASHFTKVRLRQSDAYCHSLAWDPQDQDPWYVGVVKVLAKLRKLDGDDKLSLAEFEALSPSEALDVLLPPTTLRADVLERVTELALPYAKYSGNLAALTGRWMAAQQLDTLIPLRDIPEFQESLRARALESPPEAWRTVQTVVPGLSDIANAAQVLSDVGAAPATFNDIVSWQDASSNIQLDVLIRYLRSQKNWKKTNSDLAVLSKILTKLTTEETHREVIKYALEGSRFMFLQHQLSTLDQTLLEEDIQKLVEKLGPENGVTLQQAETAAALLKRPSKKVSQTIEAAKACASYGIEPSASLAHRKPIDIVRLAIQAKPDAYESPQALRRLAQKLCSDPKQLPSLNEITEQCVEAALADDNFGIAEQLCQDLIDTSAADSGAWLAFLHVGKYVSSSWNTPRPLPFLEAQQKMLSRCLSLCPAGDIPTVLRSFKALEDELAMIDDDSIEESHTETPPRERTATPDSTERRPRDLQNLLVSGIGWAIGAPPVRD